MNHLAPGLDINLDQDVVVGDVLVCPSMNRLSIADRQRKVEPRIMQVLLLLAHHPGQSVSRDTLLHFCWGGVFVAEDSLNRCIFQLRRALRDVGSTRVRIETIPKFGYGLFIDPDPAGDLAPDTPPTHPPVQTPPGMSDTPEAGAATTLAPPPAGPAVPPPTRSKRPLWIAGLGVAVLGLLVLLFIVWQQKPGNGPMGDTINVTPLTLEPGLDLYPALSPDGRTVAYAARNSFDDYDLILRGTTRNSRPVTLTKAPEHDRVPAWSPSGDNIAFLRSARDGSCALYIIAVPVGEERLIGPCQGDQLPSIAWQPDGSALVITGIPDQATKLTRLMRMPLDGSPPSLLPLPPAEGADDWLPNYSPDGDRLAFIRALPDGQLHIIVIDHRSGEVLHRFPLDTTSLAFVWAADGKGLYVSNMSRGRRGIWHIDLKSPQWRQIVPGLGQVGRISSDRNQGNLALEVYEGNANVVEFTDKAEQRTLQGTSGDEYEPVFSPDGSAMAFVSDRTGELQVWLAEDERPTRPLTDLKGASLSGLRWSPDGRNLVFIAEVAMRSDLYQVSIADETTTRLTNDGKSKNAPAWLPDGSIRVPVRSDKDWDIWSVDGGGKPPVIVDPGMDFVDISGDGSQLLVGKRDSNELRWTALRGEGAGTITLPVTLRGARNVVVCPDRLYFARYKPPGVNLFVMDRQTGVERQLGGVPRTDWRGQISADCATGSVLLTQYVGQESDLVLLHKAEGR